MKDTQTVTTMILAQAGSKYEEKNNNGISHFLEHMMFKGTKKRPTSKLITEELDSVGGDYNAFTGKEQTGYWIKVASQHFPMALDVVSDMYLNPLLDQKEIDKERGVILQEIAMYRDTPVRYVWDVFEELLYGDQPAGWDIAGTEENIQRFSRKDFTDYLKRMYLPQATVVVVAGNFDEEFALKQLKQTFGTKRAGLEEKVMKKTAQQQKTPSLKIYYKETDQTHLIMGVRSCDMYSPERYATSLLGTVLGGGMSSRMFHNIREKYGLTYYIDAGSEQMTDTGYFFARAGVQHINLEKTIKLIIKEFEKVVSKKIGAKELTKAKEYIKGKTVMSLEASSAVASFYGDQELFKEPIMSAQEIFAKIDAVTAEDIQKVAQTIFQNKGLNFAVIGPHKDEEKLAKILKF
jgi:predicted Zn-dependent peptidase